MAGFGVSADNYSNRSTTNVPVSAKLATAASSSVQTMQSPAHSQDSINTTQEKQYLSIVLPSDVREKFTKFVHDDMREDLKPGDRNYSNRDASFACSNKLREMLKGRDDGRKILQDLGAWADASIKTPILFEGLPTDNPVSITDDPQELENHIKNIGAVTRSAMVGITKLAGLDVELETTENKQYDPANPVVQLSNADVPGRSREWLPWHIDHAYKTPPQYQMNCMITGDKGVGMPLCRLSDVVQRLDSATYNALTKEEFKILYDTRKTAEEQEDLPLRRAIFERTSDGSIIPHIYQNPDRTQALTDEARNALHNLYRAIEDAPKEVIQLEKGQSLLWTNGKTNEKNPTAMLHGRIGIPSDINEDARFFHRMYLQDEQRALPKIKRTYSAASLHETVEQLKNSNEEEAHVHALQSVRVDELQQKYKAMEGADYLGTGKLYPFGHSPQRSFVNPHAEAHSISAIPR